MISTTTILTVILNFYYPPQTELIFHLFAWSPLAIVEGDLASTWSVFSRQQPPTMLLLLQWISILLVLLLVVLKGALCDPSSCNSSHPVLGSILSQLFDCLLLSNSKLSRSPSHQISYLFTITESPSSWFAAFRLSQVQSITGSPCWLTFSPPAIFKFSHSHMLIWFFTF